MFKQIRRFRGFLGEARFWLLIGALIVTGILSLILQFDGSSGSIQLQNTLFLAFVVSAGVLIGSALDGEQRSFWASILVPALGIVILGVAFFPQYQFIAFGAAFGWIAVGLFVFGRSRAPMQYREAVKAMRDNDLKKAIGLMDDLIKEEPDVPYHYSFRARMLRLWNKPGRARRDYEQMIAKAKTDQIRAEGYNELSELEFQQGNYDAAITAAQQAYALLPDEWVTSYNLGMIEDRRGNSELVAENLERALKIRVPDSRHRLLVHVWLARAYTRLGDQEAAKEYVDALKRERKGLDEWQKILDDEQGALIRQVMGADIELAQKLMDGEAQLTTEQVAGA